MIVVILLSLGLLFLVQFSDLRAGKGDTFTQEQIAANTLNAFVLTTTNCQGLDVTELVQDCAGFRAVNCSGVNSCVFLDGLSDRLLSKTLKVWGKRYNMTAVVGATALFDSAFGGCPAARDVSVYPIPQKTGGLNIVLRLEVCRG